MLQAIPEFATSTVFEAKSLGNLTPNAPIYNFTTTLSYSLKGDGGSGGDSGLVLTAQYTSGREDITFFKLPTWSVGIKGKLSNVGDWAIKYGWLQPIGASRINGIVKSFDCIAGSAV